MNTEQKTSGFKIKNCLSVLTTLTAIIAFAACNGGHINNNNTPANTSEVASATDTNSSSEPGKTIYQKTCLVCHGASGEGVKGMYPPLAHSDFLLADKNRAIHQVLAGSSATYLVNGSSYNGMMPPQHLSNKQVAAVLNYVYHAWGNNGFTITTAEVKVVKDTIK